MPTGILLNAACVLLGGVLGALGGRWVSPALKKNLTATFGFSAMVMGFSLIVGMNSLSVVVLCMILGTAAGTLLKLERRVNNGVRRLCTPRPAAGQKAAPVFPAGQLCSVAVLFCASGTGLYGALHEGFTGSSSILITKSIMDFFTAIIFAASLGHWVSLIAVPQLVLYLLLFFAAKPVQPLITPEMLADFSAVGGMVAFMAGCKITGIKQDAALLDALPALLLVFPLSGGWTAVVQPLL